MKRKVTTLQSLKDVETVVPQNNAVKLFGYRKIKQDRLTIK